MDAKTARLGSTISQMDLGMQCKAVWGAVAFPGARPGYAIIVAMDRKPHFGSHDIYVMDEFESDSMRALVRQSAVLDRKWCPDRLIGDFENDAADKFIQEINDESNEGNKGFSIDGQRRQFSLTPTLLMEMENLYRYILDTILDLTDEKHKQLWLKESKVRTYLDSIQRSQIPEMRLGDYPAIEALAFAVLELRQDVATQEQAARLPQCSPYDNNTLMRGMKNRRLQGPHTSAYDNNTLMRGFKKR